MPAVHPCVKYGTKCIKDFVKVLHNKNFTNESIMSFIFIVLKISSGGPDTISKKPTSATTLLFPNEKMKHLKQNK